MDEIKNEESEQIQTEIAPTEETNIAESIETPSNEEGLIETPTEEVAPVAEQE